jgi:hypothetical protein
MIDVLKNELSNNERSRNEKSPCGRLYISGFSPESSVIAKIDPAGLLAWPFC